MKMEDIINALRNVIAQAEQDDDADVLAPHNADPSDGEDTMMPPLQQELELMKKMAGVESEYDDCGDSAEQDAAKFAIAKKHSGLQQ